MKLKQAFNRLLELAGGLKQQGAAPAAVDPVIQRLQTLQSGLQAQQQQQPAAIQMGAGAPVQTRGMVPFVGHKQGPRRVLQQPLGKVGMYKLAALEQAFMLGFNSRLTEMEKSAVDVKSKGFRGGDIVHALRMALGVPLNVATAPLSIPLAMWGKAGEKSEGAKSLREEGPRANAILRTLAGDQLPFASDDAARVVRGVAKPQEVEQAAKAQGESSGGGGVGSGLRTALNALLTASQGIRAPLQAGASMLGGVAGTARSPHRVAEGLSGDKPGFLRRWLDPMGARAKAMGHNISQDNPALAKKLLSRLLEKENLQPVEHIASLRA